MEKSDLKTEAVKNLLDLKVGATENPVEQKLRAAFAPGVSANLPDFEKIRQKVLARHLAAETDRRNFRKLFVPAAAAAIFVMAVGVFVFLSPANTPRPAAINAAIPAAGTSSMNIADSLTIQVRGAAGLQKILNGTSVTLRAESVQALFQFEPNDRLKAVHIELPQARFSVIGTRFILLCSRDASFLAVDSGAVQVISAGRKIVVRAGEFWSFNAGVTNSASMGSDAKKLFSEFLQPEINPQVRATSMLNRRNLALPTGRTGKRATLTLKSGSVLNGLVLSENQALIEMRTPGTGDQVLRFKRDEILDLKYEK